MNLLSSLLAFTARQIGALRTQADSNTSRIETSEGNITDLTTTVNNTIVANSNSKEVLWSGELYDDTITLSKDISNFDFIDIEYTQAVSSSTTRKTITKRIPAVAGSYEINDFAVTYDNPSIDFYKQTLTLSATSLVAAQNYNVEAASGSNTWITQRGTYQFAIVRVLGVKLGSASPSELTDIRVGADGVTYNSAGAAVRGQLSDLKSKISEVSGELGYYIEVKGNLVVYDDNVVGGYIKPGGAIASHSSFGHTDRYYEVKAGDVVRVTYNSDLTGQWLCMYGSDKVADSHNGYLANNQEHDIDNTYWEVTIPSGVAYIRFNFAATDVDSVVYTRNSTFTSDTAEIYFPYPLGIEINASNADFSGYRVDDFVTFDQHGYIDSEYGAITTHASYNIDLFTLKCGETIEAYGRGENSFSMIDSYTVKPDGTKDQYKCIQKYDASIGYKSATYTATQPVEYLRFSYRYKNPHYLKKYAVGQKTNDAVRTRIDTVVSDFVTAIYDKCVCVGDSLTEGYYGASVGTPSGKSYPDFLAKMSGWNVTNLGQGGASAQTYWDGGYLQNADLSDKDIMILFLGTNGGLTDTIDTDMVGDDYTNYANTNTGCYGKIIKYAQSQNPNLKIFLVTKPRANDDTTNTVIKAIGAKFDLPVIDLVNTPYFVVNKIYANVLHPNNDTVHFGKIGYLLIAKAILSEIVNTIVGDYMNYELPY